MADLGLAVVNAFQLQIKFILMMLGFALVFSATICLALAVAGFVVLQRMVLPDH